MGRLKAAPRRLTGLAPTLRRLDASPADQSRGRDARLEWRAWYKTARWQKMRWQILVRDGFTCAMCGRLEGDTSQLVCDHIERHGGNAVQFWAGPFQTLCKTCHDGTKQRVERMRAGRAAASRPEWLEASGVPVTLVCGPPAAGKSRYVAERAGPADLVIDLDVIAAGLVGGATRHDWSRADLLQDAMWRRNAMLGGLARRRSGRCWLIMLEPSAVGRMWWRDRLGSVDVVVLEASAEHCARQAAGDPDRDLEACARDVAAWWSAYSPGAGEVRERPGEATPEVDPQT